MEFDDGQGRHDTQSGLTQIVFQIALSVHLEIDANSQSQSILRETRKMLKQTYNVHEITIQIEEFGANRSDCGKCDFPTK